MGMNARTLAKAILPKSAINWVRDQRNKRAKAPVKRRPKRPSSVDWSLDKDNLIERLKGAICDRHGHVFLCVPDLLPASLYEACMAYWPDDEQFEQRAHSRTRITMAWLPEAPIDQEAREFWHRFGHEVVNGTIKPALTEAFLPYLERKFDFLSASEAADIRENISFSDSPNEGLNLDKGFGIGPHVDQNFIFVSSLFYMPKDNSQSHMGTMLFEPIDKSTRTLDTTFIDPSLVREKHQFPFRPNTLASFLQTPIAFHGMVGRSSPEPRRSYQFNIHIDPETVSRAYDGRPTGTPGYIQPS
jgi:hypothetical protein